MTEKKELFEAYYQKESSTLSQGEKFIISAKGESVEEAMELFRKIKKEMHDTSM